MGQTRARARGAVRSQSRLRWSGGGRMRETSEGHFRCPSSDQLREWGQRPFSLVTQAYDSKHTRPVHGEALPCGGLFILGQQTFAKQVPSMPGTRSGLGDAGSASAAWVPNMPEGNNYPRLASCSWQRPPPEEPPWVRDSESGRQAARAPRGSQGPNEGTPQLRRPLWVRTAEQRTREVGEPRGEALAVPGPRASATGDTAAPTASLLQGPARHESQASRAHFRQQPEAASWTASPAATSPCRLVCGVFLGGEQGGPGSLCPLMSPQLRDLVQDRYFHCPGACGLTPAVWYNWSCWDSTAFESRSRVGWPGEAEGGR
ncbi:uncharacterized protein LOC123955530 [Meles meles]|uniref:uncharacterized protein LOC123955530 n=1 Tax=Meles meles TaxID=9662 RepID=UPI001E6A0D83|nr:uncharacterized protein LOC123955530 [Meles meles]